MNDPRFDGGYSWHKSDRKPLQMVWLPLGAEFVKAVCPPVPGYSIYACSFYEADACLVVAALPLSQAPAYQVAHESAHCSGWDHDQPVNFPNIAFVR